VRQPILLIRNEVALLGWNQWHDALESVNANELSIRQMELPVPYLKEVSDTVLVADTRLLNALDHEISHLDTFYA